MRELRSCSPDQLMYVKEDLILPHSLTFYELIVKKANSVTTPTTPTTLATLAILAILAVLATLATLATLTSPTILAFLGMPTSAAYLSTHGNCYASRSWRT